MRIKIKDKENFIQMFNNIFEENKIDTINAVSIDSRNIQEGDIFIPIKGERFDGHKFISQALNDGAIKCFSENTKRNENIINIKSTKNIINKLAKSWQEKSKHKIIGITGSNGKTSAKELLNFILSKKFSCSKTEGNYNSSIGLPISYLSSQINNNYCIIEYGASKPGEIEDLCKIVKPNISLITNISNAHIKNYNSINEISITKNAIFTCLGSNDIAFINIDDKHILKDFKNCKKITFSLENKANYFLQNYDRNKRTMLINGEKLEIPPNLLHLKSLILSVYAISRELGVKHIDINRSLKEFRLPNGRGLTIDIKGMKIIDDSYNANPSSVILAIERIDLIKNNGNKIFILGDMLELGKESISEHGKIAEYLNKSSINIVITYGKYSYSTFTNLKNSIIKKHFSDIDQLKSYLKKITEKGDLIYLKGSRSMQLERIYKAGLA